MELFFEISGNQIDGARDYQEDAFLTTYLDDASGEPKGSALAVMADGMGGHAAGNIASNMVVSTFNKAVTGRFGKEDISGILRDSLIQANHALKSSITETPALEGMGCTMVTAAFTSGKVWWVSVGDSHLYLLRGRELIKENEDHSYGGYLDRMKAQGMDVEPEPGLSRNMLMSAMTGEDIAEIDCPRDPLVLQAGDRVIVASDGLDTLSAGTIIYCSEQSPSPRDCVETLLKAVDEAKKPRQDNTTVIVVDVVERSATDQPAPPPLLAEEVPVDAGDTQPMEPFRAVPEEEYEEYDEYEEEEEEGGSKRFVIGIAAAVLLAVAGVGAWFAMGKKEAPTTGTTVVVTSEGGEKKPPEKVPDTKPEAKPTAEVPPEKPAPSVPTTPTVEPAPTVEVAAQEFQDNLKAGGKGPVMVSIPAGSFEMGSSGLSVTADERPRHKVTVEAFAVSKHEVTIAEYERFTKATNRKLPDTLYMDKGTHPVIFVTWDDAFAYTQWLSRQTGKKYRLPSEAEWEYTASAGKKSPYWWGFEIGQNNAHCHGCETGLDPRKPTQVGRFKPNPFGVYDAYGNVAEWVHDCYHRNYQGAPDDGSVWQGGECTYRIARGGAYDSPPSSLRSQKRSKLLSTNGYSSVGIRLARDL